jgi:hypothetical protein
MENEIAKVHSKYEEKVKRRYVSFTRKTHVLRVRVITLWWLFTTLGREENHVFAQLFQTIKFLATESPVLKIFIC